MDKNNVAISKEKYDTSAYVVNQVYSVLTPKFSFLRNILLKSNNNIYSLEKNNAQNNMYYLTHTKKDDFIKYGFGYGYIENLNKPIDKTCYVLQETVSQNEQGFWTKQTNKKPLSISFN
ncbi:hypothetical protein MPH48_04025 [Lysinibacillus fusiformis]|uniref:hypothetical protein n=1 Tax=Lysinibacillus fusiformis TaxID=28031 RepID=UPI001F4D797A|nr:hypothetical protein [Lysinibacillus fusiformis]MCK1987268.1 hypothetical protein [Lysinibacillus fusiformis]